MTRQQWISLLTINVLLVLFIAFWMGKKRQAQQESQQIYQKLEVLEEKGAFDFATKTIDGEPFQLHAVAGHIVLLNFWASWCAPCVIEYPSMLRLIERYNGKIKLVTVSLDDEKQDALNFFKRYGRGDKNVIHIWDEDKSIAKRFGTEKLPETYIFNSDFKLIRKVPNSEDWERREVLDYLDQFID